MGETVMYTTIRPLDALTADPRDLVRIVRTLPAMTIADALHLAQTTGRMRLATVRMMQRELDRRMEATEMASPVLVEIPPYDKATPEQLLGGITAAGWTVKTLAARLGVVRGTMYRVIRKEGVSRRLQIGIMRAISGKLKSE